MLLKKQFAHLIESFEKRAQNVRKFCNLFKPEVEIEIHELKVPAGPAGTDEKLDAIIFTKEVSVSKGIEFVHKIREERGLPKLEEFEIELIQNDNSKISSS